MTNDNTQHDGSSSDDETQTLEKLFGPIEAYTDDELDAWLLHEGITHHMVEDLRVRILTDLGILPPTA